MRTSPCPQVRWISVVDGAGHRHLEMRWSLPATVRPNVQPAVPATPRAA